LHSYRGIFALVYRIVAARDDETVAWERTSRLIAVAKARVWASEGWQVVVTHGEEQLDPAEFETSSAA
jgi:hypothetical protein